ncbi:MAG: hypothetical protein IKG19_05315 [Lachnospiraceae bacterium]|nr:hypothetical protein [Lachnospiraceae bacterium]
MSHPSEKKASQITEVKARMPITSVIFISRHSTQTENYGSRRRNLDYFRKCRAPTRKKQGRITEVEAKMEITSVNVELLPEKAGQDYGSKRKNPVYFRNLLLQGQATMLAWSSDPPIKV